MLTQLKALLALSVLLAVIGIAGMIYWRGSSNATAKNDLRIARETIKVEREALKITHTIDMRVNAEGIQTAQTAQGAANEIESIRVERNANTATAVALDAPPNRGTVGCDASCARVLQLAREARAAAVASSARLQSTGTGTR